MRRVVAPALAAAVVAAVVVAVVALTRSDGPEPAEDGAAEVPSRWRIVYEVEIGEAVVTDVVTVRRPFESRLETHRADDATDGGQPASLQTARFARLAQTSEGASPSVLAVPPAPAPSDVRLDVVIPAALEEGLLLLRGQREIAGRRCQVYRSGALLTAGVLAPATDDEFADTCVDPSGLVLEEVLVVEGETLIRRTATEVDLAPDIDDAAFETGEPTVPPDAGGGSVLPLAPGSGRPGAFWVLRQPPAGFRLCGRFSVVPPQPAGENEGGDQRVASVAQVFVRGRDLLVVDQGATLQGAAPFPVGVGPAVDLGAVGEGELVLGPQASEVRAVVGGGEYVRVLATLRPEEIVSAARRLVVEEEGGPLDVRGGEEPVCRPAGQ